MSVETIIQSRRTNKFVDRSQLVPMCRHWGLTFVRGLS